MTDLAAVIRATRASAAALERMPRHARGGQQAGGYAIQFSSFPWQSCGGTIRVPDQRARSSGKAGGVLGESGDAGEVKESY